MNERAHLLRILSGKATPMRAIGGGRVTVILRRVGEIHLESGRVAMCDPLAPSEVVTLGVTAPPGVYPVSLALASQEDGGALVAYAVLELPPSSVRNPPWSSDVDVGYPVDSGTGCFLDAAQGERWQDAPEKEFDELFEALTSDRGVGALGRAMESGEGPRLVAFSSGDGDGVYATYCVRTEAALFVVTDFDCVELESSAPEPEPEPGAHSPFTAWSYGAIWVGTLILYLGSFGMGELGILTFLLVDLFALAWGVAGVRDGRKSGEGVFWDFAPPVYAALVATLILGDPLGLRAVGPFFVYGWPFLWLFLVLASWAARRHKRRRREASANA